MKDYKHFLRESFEYPELQNDSNLKERVSSPLELFFDSHIVKLIATFLPNELQMVSSSLSTFLALN